jgi:hypothetical protein
MVKGNVQNNSSTKLYGTKKNTKLKRMVEFGIVHNIYYIIFFIGEIIMKLAIAKGNQHMIFKAFQSVC